MKHEELSQLTDHQLLSRTTALAQHERDHSITIICHLREIRERGLHLERGYSSLFDYAVKALFYSEGAAYRRLQTLKLCEAHPEVEERLRSGVLSLTTAAQLQTAIEKRRERQQGGVAGASASDAATLGLAGVSSDPEPQPELTFQTGPAAEQQPAPDLRSPTPEATPEATAAAPAPPREQPASIVTPPVLALAVPLEPQPAPTAAAPVPASQPPRARVAPPAQQPQATPVAAPAPSRPPAPTSEPQRAPESQPVSPPQAVSEEDQNRDLIRQAEGQSSRQVARLIADLNPHNAPPRERLRALGGGRWELRVVVDDSCNVGLEELRALLSHIDPALSYGELLARLVADGQRKYDPRRQPGRAAARGDTGTAPRRALAAAPIAAVRKRQGTSAPKPAPAAADAAAASNPVPKRQGTSAPKCVPGAADPHRVSNAVREWQAAKPGLAVADAAAALANSVASTAAALATKPAGAAVESPSAPKRAAIAAPGSAATLAVATAGAAAEPEPDHRQPLPRSTAPGRRDPNSAPAEYAPPVPPRRAQFVARAIPAALRRYIWRRDDGACTFVDPDTGHRCGSRHLVQIDNLQPFAMGGPASAENLRLLCSAHNRHRARKSFGARRSSRAGGGR